MLIRTVRLSLLVCLLGLMSPLTATARHRQGPCADGSHLVGWVGINSLSSRFLSVSHQHSHSLPRVWFRQEPTVDEVDPSGPAAGLLREGDVLTSVDGILITTRSGSGTLVNPAIGETVTLGVRRGGREVEIRVRAVGICPEDAPQFWETPPAPAPPAPPARPAPRSPQNAPQAPTPPTVPRPDIAPPSPPSPPIPPRPASVPAPPAPPMPPPPPPDIGASFGFGFECSNCGWSKEEGGFFFDSDPVVYSVDPDSPASRAGIQRGDRLEEVDGLELTSPEGGRRFFSIEPGEEVRLTFLRDGQKRSVVVRSKERLSFQWRFALKTTERLHKRLQERLNESISTFVKQAGQGASGEAFADRIQEDINRQIEEIGHSLSQIAPEPPQADSGIQNLRYAGTISNVDVEVRGLASVDVTVDEETGIIFIRTPQATIRLTKAPAQSTGRGR